MLFIGVDVGTSAVKLLLMDEAGKIHNIVSKEYPLFFPHPGWSEQNPSDWFNASLEGIKELTADCDKSEVAGISFGGQMHGLVTLDKDDNVIRPAILWNDGRTGKETEYLNTVIGKDKLSAYTANIAFAGFTAPKILWMKANEPENFARIAKIMLPKDYLAYKLSGAFCTDYSDASGYFPACMYKRTVFQFCKRASWRMARTILLVYLADVPLPRIPLFFDIRLFFHYFKQNFG